MFAVKEMLSLLFRRMLNIAAVFSFKELNNEIDEILITDTLVENWTYPLIKGLKEFFEWYINNKDKVNRKPYIEYIDSTLKTNSER